MTQWRRRALVLTMLALWGSVRLSAQAVTVEVVARGLLNPRGVAVLADGRLLVAEAGIGADEPGQARGSGQISMLADVNGDGDYDDAGEREIIAGQFPSYNGLDLIRTGHDEVFGLSDVVVLDDGRMFFTLDDPYAEPARNTDDLFEGNTGVFELLPDGEVTRVLKTAATANALVYDPERALLYTTESGFNRLTALTLDGDTRTVADIPLLASAQQAVPSGLAFDARTGDVLVALFSGFVYTYGETPISFMPGDAKIIRIDPDTGAISDAITGLTTAIDVAIDPEGNLYVVELTTEWPPALMPYDFDLFDPNARPDPGGYARYTGRVTMHPPGAPPITLAEGLDAPTNITYADGRLYVSTGLGTPGRSAWSRDGVRPIDGQIVVISGF